MRNPKILPLQIPKLQSFSSVATVYFHAVHIYFQSFHQIRSGYRVQSTSGRVMEALSLERPSRCHQIRPLVNRASTSAAYPDTFRRGMLYYRSPNKVDRPPQSLRLSLLLLIFTLVVGLAPYSTNSFGVANHILNSSSQRFRVIT